MHLAQLDHELVSDDVEETDNGLEARRETSPLHNILLCEFRSVLGRCTLQGPDNAC